MRPGKHDKRASLHFSLEELDFLQDNTWKMADAFGLDTRIAKLTGKRAVQFYAWDLECLYEVSDSARDEAPAKDHPMIDALLQKLREAMNSLN
jgi:hypothetical protein